MNKYWFKKHGKNGAFPVTWEGWAYFALVIGIVTQAPNLLRGIFAGGILGAAISAGLVAAIGFYGMRFKTKMDEQFDKEKDKGTYKQIWGALVGFVLLLMIVIVIGGILHLIQNT